VQRVGGDGDRHDTYTTADAILTTDHFGDGSDTEVVPVQHGGRRLGRHRLLNTRAQLSWVTGSIQRFFILYFTIVQN